MKLNTHYQHLSDNYLFAKVAEKVADFTKANPSQPLYHLGIGDVTLPLVPVVVDALQKATAEMADKATFRGYGTYQGYPFLREAISSYYKNHKQVELHPDEVFISSGSKGDCTGILELFSPDNTVLIPNPTYPVYVDANIMDGRKIIFATANQANDFLPLPNPDVSADIIYICSPNNPTGAVYNRTQLKAWVDYAKAQGAILLYDGAYEAFISDDLPSSIFEIEGARDCAIEFMTFSKLAGFTGVRCSFITIPKGLTAHGQSLHALWLRRQTTRGNSVSYIVQRGAEAALSPTGLQQLQTNLAYYKHNTQIIGETLDRLGIYYTGGKNAPYVWLACPGGMSSWEFFDFLLHRTGIIGTPGAGFGTEGEGYFRLSAFGDQTATRTAMTLFESEVKHLC